MTRGHFRVEGGLHAGLRRGDAIRVILERKYGRMALSEVVTSWRSSFAT